MLDHDVPISEGWQLAWIQRTFEPLLWSCLVAANLPIYVCAVNDMLYGSRVRKLGKEMEQEPDLEEESNLEELRVRFSQFARLCQIESKHKRVRFFAEGSWLASILVIFAVDAFIAVAAMWENGVADVKAWDTLLLAGSFDALYYSCVAILSFSILPLLGILFTMGAVVDSGKDEGSTYLSENAHKGLPWYTLVSIRLCCMQAFQIIVGTSPIMKLPVDEHPTWRCFIISILFGYFCTSFCLNFALEHRVKDLEELRLRERGFKGFMDLFQQILCIFKTVPRSGQTEGASETTVESYSEKSPSLQD